MKRPNHVLPSRVLRGLHGVHLPGILVVLSAVALITGRSPCVSAGGPPEVVALPPERPGTIFYFGEGVRPAPEGETVDENPYSIASAGDVDGDGFEDLLCNANPELLGFWVVFLVHGQPSPPETLLLDAPSEHVSVIRNSPGGLEQGMIIRPGLAAAGDVDKDGFDDVLISVPYEGRVCLLFGSPELHGADIFLPPTKGAVTWYQSGETLGGGTPRTENGVAAVGDLNGDGSPEFAFAAPFENEDNGRVYVASWTPELRTVGEIDVAKLGDTFPGFIFEGVSLHDRAEGDHAGDMVSAAGDLNGDGFDDLCLGTIASSSTWSSARRFCQSR